MRETIMTVAELIKELEKMPEDAEVHQWAPKYNQSAETDTVDYEVGEKIVMLWPIS